MITGWAKRWVLERFQKQGKAPPIGEDFFPLVGGGKRPAASKTPCHAVDGAGTMGHHPGIPRIHGWVYDIATGLITDLAKADATLANTWKD